MTVGELVEALHLTAYALPEPERARVQERVREPERMPELQAQVLPLQEPQEQPA